MPMPWTYRHAQKEFASFLADAKEHMGHLTASDNLTYTAVEGVLRTFRARLTPQQALSFADVLPSIVRAIFVSRWDLSVPQRAFGSLDEMTKEAQALRPHHNLTPDNCIEATAIALWRHVNHQDLARVLAQIGPEAEAFWDVSSLPRDCLDQKVI